MFGKRLSTGVSLRPKRGLQGWKNKARQGYKNHGRCGPPRSARGRARRECHSTRSQISCSHLGRNGDFRSSAESGRRQRYDSDKLDSELSRYGIQLISPHRSNRKNRTQDLRRLRRYHHRWKIERLFAWLQNFRRLVVRYERYAENFLGMLHLGCCIILLRYL